MASSGGKYGTVSQRSTVYKTRIYWYTKSFNAMTGKSKVNIAFFLDRTNTEYEFEDNVRDVKIEVNGSPITKPNFYMLAYDANWGPNNSILIHSTDVDITHDVMGNASFTTSAYCNIAGPWGPGICEVKVGTYTLDNIDRNPPSVTNLRVGTLTKNSINYLVDVVKASGVDWSSYRLNGGAWINASGNVVTGLIAGTTYTLQVRYRATVNGLWGESNILTFTTSANDNTPPSLVSADVKVVDNTTIYAMSTWGTLLDGMKEVKVSIDNGVTFNKSLGNITGLTSSTTYQVKFKAIGNNLQETITAAYPVTTAASQIKTQKLSGSYKLGLISTVTVWDE